MTFTPGDRVRHECVDDDGLPLVYYGFVDEVRDDGTVIVLLDVELGYVPVHVDELQPVDVTTVELLLDGRDLVDDPELRRGLVSLWQAEADDAGLDIDAVHAVESCTGRCNQQERWCLAELEAGGERYVLRAEQAVGAAFMVRVHADRAS